MFIEKREETLPTLFWILCNPDTKTRQTHCKKRKLQTNIHNKHKCKNYSNIKQLNPAIQKKKKKPHDQTGFITGIRNWFNI